MKIPMKIPLSTLKFTKAGPKIGRPLPPAATSQARCQHAAPLQCETWAAEQGSPLEIRENDGFHQQKSEGIHDDFTGKIMCFEHI